MSGLLASIFSAGDRLKRKVNGLLDDPAGTLVQHVGLLNDRAGEFNKLHSEATQELVNAMRNGGNGMGPKSQQLAGLLADSYNPIGMVAFKGPQAEALETARKNAVKMLGLPENNTPMDRARALGFDADAVHFSRHGIDVNELDSGKFAIAPFDAVGTHVGTKEAALDRFRNTVATTDQIKGTTYPVLIKRGEEFVSPKTGGAWAEDDLSAALFERGGYADAKDTFQSLNQKLRRDLFRGSGYDSIPYVNDVESKGAVSYIVPPQNIRSRFAAFDPARINENDLLGRINLPMLGLLGAGAGGAAYLTKEDR